MSKNTKYNEQKIISVLRDYKQGELSTVEVAKKHEVTPMNVSQWVKSAGLKRREEKSKYDWELIKKEIGATQ